MNYPKIVFLLESISQPRCIKRVNSFISHGYDIEIYGIDRGKYNENAFISGKKINIIDNQSDGRDHLNKFINNNKAIQKILKQYKNDRVVYYIFGFALCFSLKLNGCKNYIYEISDILYGYKKFYLVRPMFKLLDQYLIKGSILTIMTSEGFSKYFFKSKIPQNIVIQPNKLDFSFTKKERPKIDSKLNVNKIRFAYVGAFRYPNTVFRFANIIGMYYPKHEFYFYGDSYLTNQVISIANKYDNVKYFGSFKNPDDLTSIYNNLDVLIACYDISSLNERIAEPNKLYEALYFNKPIIVSKNTFLAEKVRRLECGYEIDASCDHSVIAFIDSLHSENIMNITKKNSRINSKDIIDDNSNAIITLLDQLY